jgi:serine/threonine protein kinase
MIGDRYEIQQQLGKKAGRQTLLAIDRRTHQPVVLKRLTFSPDFGWDDLKLFEREIEALRSLCHPCIPRYLDHFELDLPDSKSFVLVQSYVNGRSLEDYLKAGRRFTEPDLKQLAHALLTILSYLHGQHPPVIHRDIKPSNILLSDRAGNSLGQVYLVDFGSVQTLAARAGGTMTIVGTYGYMPPEQFGGRATAASDLYSLGASLIYLATGKHPADLPQKQLRLQFESLANLNLDLVKWLRRMVEPGLNERFTSANHALQSLLQPPDTTYDRAQLPVSRNQPAVEKPPDSKVVLIKRAGWIDILVPESSEVQGSAQPAYTRLYIDNQEISLHSAFGHDLPPGFRPAIVGLECCHSSALNPGSVRILTTRHTYSLGENGSLSPAELNWLADELSEWLGLPIVQS